ncbi:MAG: hypothetical protein HON90_18210 [Halobacteriovoraceae bacterium]|jgi:hypothetical protein|nr:hypothetical protein [Halobacteriovoraceae bacterium]
MNKFALIFCLLLSLISTSHAYQIEIVDIELPRTDDESYLVFATDGRVYEIAADNYAVVDFAHEAWRNREVIEVQFSNNLEVEELLSLRNEIQKINFLSKPKFELKRNLKKGYSREKNSDLTRLKNTYITNVDSELVAQELFKTQKSRMRSWSQCYNRAHVWAWELNKKTYGGKKIQVGKIWIYFTKKYIREYRHKWWFHIAPYITVNNDLRVMDKSYLKKPLPEKVWTDQFVKSKQVCPEIFKYSDYSEYPNSSHCYVMKTSLFYWQPFHIENLEKLGEERIGWNSGELVTAYKNAIGFFARVP